MTRSACRPPTRPAETGETTPHDPHVVDVRVIEPVRSEDVGARTIITDQVGIGVTPQRIAGEVRTRGRLTICPRGGDVFLGNSGVTLGTGFLVKADQLVVILASDALYAVAAAAGVATVHLLAEVREG